MPLAPAVGRDAHFSNTAELIQAPTMNNLGWFPLIPCCPHCRTTAVPRATLRGDSTNPAYLCLDCHAKPGVVRRAEPVPDLLRADSWREFQKDPDAWLKGQLGRTAYLALPPRFRAKEAHRLLHVACARFWGDEEVAASYDALAPPSDVWSLEAHSSVTGIEVEGIDHSESPDVQEHEVKHAFHVRIWRSRFNKSVAEPLLSELALAGVPMLATSIARNQKDEAPSPLRRCSPALVIDRLGDPPSKTLWSLVIDVEGEEVSVVLRGEGHHAPTTMTILYDGGESAAAEDVPFDLLIVAEFLKHVCAEGR